MSVKYYSGHYEEISTVKPLYMDTLGQAGFGAILLLYRVCPDF